MMESYLSVVADLAISLKQDSTTGFFMEAFQNFQNRYFLCNTSRQLLLNLYTILIVLAPSFLLYFYLGTKGGGGLTSSGFYVGISPG